MNHGIIALIIAIPSTIVAIVTIWDLLQVNPIMNIELIMPLWLVISSLAGSFGLGFFIIYLKQKRKSGGYAIISTGSTPLGRHLREKYGEGFTRDDELILEAINKGNQSSEDIAIFTDLSEKLIKERLTFMKIKGVDEITFYDD